MKNKPALLLLTILVLLFANAAIAQDRISSPYSRFGIGELFQNTHVHNMAMGGISQAVYTPFFINPANPSSYAGFDTLSFIFDVSLHGRLTNLRTSTISQSADYASLGNLLFGFPVTSYWNASFGLLPYSATGYKMMEHKTDSVFDNYNNIYEGSGGTNQFYIGSSFNLTKNLIIGANAAWLFGSMEHNTATEFPDSLYFFDSKTTKATYVGDFLFNYGIMYHKEKASGFHYTLGASFTAQTDINTTADNISYTYTGTSTGVENIRDTIDFTSGTKEKITLPMALGAGISIGKSKTWLVGADFNFREWEKFKFSAAPDKLVNNMQFALGGFYNPSSSTVSNYFSRVTYRAGIRYSNGFLQLRNQRIDEFGISFGVGLPLPRTNSTINLAVEAGSRGTEKANLINENYVKFTLGLSIFERWFVIRKYE